MSIFDRKPEPSRGRQIASTAGKVGFWALVGAGAVAAALNETTLAAERDVYMRAALDDEVQDLQKKRTPGVTIQVDTQRRTNSAVIHNYDVDGFVGSWNVLGGRITEIRVYRYGRLVRTHTA